MDRVTGNVEVKAAVVVIWCIPIQSDMLKADDGCLRTWAIGREVISLSKVPDYMHVKFNIQVVVCDIWNKIGNLNSFYEEMQPVVHNYRIDPLLWAKRVEILYDPCPPYRFKKVLVYNLFV